MRFIKTAQKPHKFIVTILERFIKFAVSELYRQS